MQPHLRHSGPQRIPGSVRGNKLIKTVKVRNRMSCPFPGWGISVEQLRSAQARGVQVVELRVDTGEVFSASIRSIFAEGKPIQHPPFEPQLLVPLKAWSIVDPEQPELFGGAHE